MDHIYLGLVLTLLFIMVVGIGYLFRGGGSAVKQRRKPRPQLRKSRRMRDFGQD